MHLFISQIKLHKQPLNIELLFIAAFWNRNKHINQWYSNKNNNTKEKK